MVDRPINLSTGLSIFWSRPIYLSIYLLVYRSIYLHTYLPICITYIYQSRPRYQRPPPPVSRPCGQLPKSRSGESGLDPGSFQLSKAATAIAATVATTAATTATAVPAATAAATTAAATAAATLLLLLLLLLPLLLLLFYDHGRYLTQGAALPELLSAPPTPCRRAGRSGRQVGRRTMRTTLPVAVSPEDFRLKPPQRIGEETREDKGKTREDEAGKPSELEAPIRRQLDAL